MPSLDILNIGKEQKYSVHKQIRLIHLIRECTISFSAFFNKHKRQMILNIGLKYTVLEIIMLQLIRVYAIICSAFSSNTVKILKFGTPQTIAIIVLKIEKFDVTLH